MNGVKKITDQQIIAQIGMAEMPKIIHILKKKHGRNVEFVPIENDLMLRVGETNVANMSYLPVYLHFLTVSDDVLNIEGNISVPTELPDYAFYSRINGQKKEAVLQDCGLDLKIGDEIYEKRTIFRLEIPLQEHHNTIEFFNSVCGIECRCARINSFRFAPIADCIKGQYCVFHNWVFQISGNTIVCHKLVLGELAEYENRFQKEISLLNKENRYWAIDLRNKYFDAINSKKNPIWLIMDRSDRAGDNGEFFFKYMQQYSEVDTYFVIDKESEDYQRLQTIGNVIPMYSEKHYLLTLLSDCIISSQCNGFVENPFWENAEYFRDLYHRPKLIFLQHGVIKDDMSPTLVRFNTNFKGFVTSTLAEYQSIFDYPYYYDTETIWLTGLPIFDELKNNEQQYICVAPTWRKELMRQEWNEKKHEMMWVPSVDIKKSDYYKKYRALLRNKDLNESCKKNGYRLAFKPHPLMEPYIKDITDGTDAVFMGMEISYRDMLGIGNLMVTDYSSLAFEFAYLGKSTIYFQFDKERFFASHTYRKGYFDYERDGFGEVCSCERDIVSLLIGYMENGCTVKKVYEQRIRELYPYHGGACKRLYQHIKKNIVMREAVTEGLSGQDFEQIGKWSSIVREGKECVQYNPDGTKQSFFYRFGHALTALPRKLKDIIDKGDA